MMSTTLLPAALLVGLSSFVVAAEVLPVESS